MSNPSTSDLSEINNAIKSQNIFKNIGVFRSNNIWGRGYPDVTNFNSHASNTVLKALEEVQKSRKHKVTSLVLTATQGQGKTHLIHRVRRQLLQQKNTAFIYANVLDFTDLNQVNFYFQQAVVDSLSRVNDGVVTQWQSIATAIVNHTTKQNRSPIDLVSRFDRIYQNSLEKESNLIDLLIQKVHTQKSIDPYILRAVLWTLSKKFSSYAEKWLSGETLEDAHARYLGLPKIITNQQDHEAAALTIIKQIFSLIGDYSSVIICFDEIDTGIRYNDAGLITQEVIATLIKSLYDTLEQSQLGKGVVIVSVMLSDTYRDLCNEFMSGGAFSARLSSFTEGNSIDLQFIDAVSMPELVKLYLKIFYDKRNLTPPTSFYPFDEEIIKKYAKINKPTMREALKWCSDNFKVDEEALPSDPKECFDLALDRENGNDFTEYLEDSELIAKVLRFGFTVLIGETLNGKTSSGESLNNVIIQDVVDILPKSKNNGWINFKIIGTDSDHDFKIGVMVLQYTYGKAVGAGMNRIVDYQTFDLTRGCVIRSKDRAIKSSWDSYKLVHQLIEQQGGELTDLVFEEIQDLIKLYTVNEQKDSYRLTSEQITEFSKPYMINNPLLLEILSNPSGEIGLIIDDPDTGEIDLLDVELSNLLNNYQLGELNPLSIPEDELIEAIEEVAVNPTQDNTELPSVSDLPSSESTEVLLWFQKTYTGQSIKAFVFNESEYDVTTWREFLITVCTLMKLSHKKEFINVLGIKGRKNNYFSKNSTDLKNPEKISGSGIYVETNLSADQIVKFVHRIVTVFGYKEDCIQVILDEN